MTRTKNIARKGKGSQSTATHSKVKSVEKVEKKQKGKAAINRDDSDGFLKNQCSKIMSYSPCLQPVKQGHDLCQACLEASSKSKNPVSMVEIDVAPGKCKNAVEIRCPNPVDDEGEECWVHSPVLVHIP